jgi:FAD/FMN-containing dehydrogenase
MNKLQRIKKYKRSILIVLSIGLLGLGGMLVKPLIYLLPFSFMEIQDPEVLPPGYIDDASHLNRTKVAEIWQVPIDHKNPEGQIGQLLARAKAEGRHVSIAGARHSMGGHTIYPDGIAINMLPFNHMQLDESRNILKVQAGAIWEDVIEHLDKQGLSVGVMQSFSSFSVGGSLSVNCHGWQHDRPPIASTVESFRLMKADGSVARCSRTENSELFSLALGGYGLFGIILDVELRVVPNERYQLKQYIVPLDESLATFDSKIKDHPDVAMVYARMNIAPDHLFEEVIINILSHDATGKIPSLSEPGMVRLRRAIFRGSAESDYGKELRWTAETKLQPFLSSKVFSRNQLLNESVDVLQNNSADSTDILHEYFVPRRHVTKFVEALRKIVPQHEANLLNVTVRTVNEDEDTFLRYADQPMIAFVMLFAQNKTAAGESKMQAITQDLIDAAIENDGRYYLPYRMHATHDQFHQAYPQADKFFALKRKYDPGELFQNLFYVKYGGMEEILY